MTLPLTGIKVLDITANMSGPFGTMILGDQGADVIKLEPPDRRPDPQPRHRQRRPLRVLREPQPVEAVARARPRARRVASGVRAAARLGRRRRAQLPAGGGEVAPNRRRFGAGDAAEPHPRHDRGLRLDRTEGRPSRVRPRDPGDVRDLRSPAQPAHRRAGDGAQRHRRQAHRLGDGAGRVRRARRPRHDRRRTQRRGVHARRQRRDALARRDDEPHGAASGERASRHRQRVQAVADPRRAHLVHHAHPAPDRRARRRVRPRRSRHRDRGQRAAGRRDPARGPGDGVAHDRRGARPAGPSRRARLAGRGAGATCGPPRRSWRTGRSRRSSTRCSARSTSPSRRCGSRTSGRPHSALRHGSAPTTTRSLRCWRGERADPQAFGSRDPPGRQPPRHQRARHGGVAPLLVRPARVQAGGRAAPAREPSRT